MQVRSVIKQADMSEEMQKEAITIAKKAFQDFKTGKHRAANIKR